MMERGTRNLGGKVTKDGVIIKSGMKVYSPYRFVPTDDWGTVIGKSRIETHSGVVYFKTDGYANDDPTECYSTKEAAKNANSNDVTGFPSTDT